MTRLRTLAWAVVIAAAVGAPEARALTFLQAMTGDEAAPVDARSAAMGRSHGATGFVGVTASINPALLARARVLEITASGNVHRMQETRSIPAYDSFDAYLVESIYALNHMSSSDISFGVAGSPDGDDFGSRVGLGVTYAPIWDFRYDYTEQIRDPNAFTQPRDDLLGLNDIQSDGRIAATSLGAALQVFDWLDLGVALDVARGRQQLLTRE
ncbi:MAG: hypothetical protein KC591_02700, partial [Gemmatimonadetes bacterium]|nr:hypothetical protein [Gemmatimonadota bacterium]